MYLIYFFKSFYLVYSQSDYDETGYNVGQTNITYKYGGAELTCFVSKKLFPVQWKKIDINGLDDPIEISYGNNLIINDSRFSLHIHNTGLLYTIKVSRHKHKLIIVICNKKDNFVFINIIFILKTISDFRY